MPWINPITSSSKQIPQCLFQAPLLAYDSSLLTCEKPRPAFSVHRFFSSPCVQFPAHPKPPFRCADQKLTSRKGETFAFWLLICFYFPPSASLRHDQFIYSCVSFYLGFFIKVMFSFIFNSFLSSVVSFLIFLILICGVLSW